MARKESVLRAQQKTAGFAAAKKSVMIQYRGHSLQEEDLMELIRKDAEEKGVPEESVSTIDVYIKPEDMAVYYVLNKTIQGSIHF